MAGDAAVEQAGPLGGETENSPLLGSGPLASPPGVCGQLWLWLGVLVSLIVIASLDGPMYSYSVFQTSLTKVPLPHVNCFPSLAWLSVNSFIKGFQIFNGFLCPRLVRVALVQHQKKIMS